MIGTRVKNTKIIKKAVIFWRRYKKNRAAVLGLIFILFLTLISCIAPYITKYDPRKISVGELLESPSTEYFMGTDNLGRDIYSMVVYGGRVSLVIGALAAIISTGMGIAIGTMAGYYGGRIDDLLMRVVDIVLIIPRFFLGIILVAISGPNMWNIVFVIAILSWPSVARLVRAEFLSLKERQFVEAAVALGARDIQIIFLEILPNALVPIIANGMIQVSNAIILESGLSFLGLSDPNIPSWGRMIANAQNYLRQAWWMAVFPGIAIFLAILGINLVGDGLNDALNPKLRER